MKKYIIDTNALISFLTDRNPDQQERIAAIFEESAVLKAQVFCPQNVLAELVYVMEKVYGASKREINGILRDFIDTPGITLVHEIDVPVLLAMWPAKILDYGDAIVAATSKIISGSVVATFDRRFRASLRKIGIPVIPL